LPAPIIAIFMFASTFRVRRDAHALAPIPRTAPRALLRLLQPVVYRWLDPAGARDMASGDHGGGF
jgi:hypothetical protein